MNSNPVYNHPSVELFFNEIKGIKDDTYKLNYLDKNLSSDSSSELKPYSHVVKPEVNKISLSYNEGQLGHLSNLGIIAPQLINSLTIDEHIRILSSSALNLAFNYGELKFNDIADLWDSSFSETVIRNLKFIDNPIQWVLNLFRKNKRTFKVINPIPQNMGLIPRKLVSKILRASNIVYENNRRGPANTMIVGGRMSTIIQDSIAFSCNLETLQTSNATMPIHCVGTLSGIAVYVDTNMKWDDNRILLFRRGRNDEPGLYLYYKSSDTSSENILYSGVQNIVNPIAPGDTLDILVKEIIAPIGFSPESNFLVVSADLPEIY